MLATCDRWLPWLQHGGCIECVTASAEFEESAKRYIRGSSRTLVGNHHNLFGVGIRQRFKQYRLDRAEDCCARSDTKRQGANYDNRESGSSQALPKRE